MVPIPIPSELVVTIPMEDPLFRSLFVGEYTNCSPVLKLCLGIVIVEVEVSIPVGSKV